MKKIIAIILTLSLLLVFASCETSSGSSTDSDTTTGSTATDTAGSGSGTGSSTGSGGTETPPDVLTADKAFEAIVALLAEDYSALTITVVTKSNGNTLTDTFKINYLEDGKKTVEYSITTVNEIDIDDEGLIVVPEERYSVVNGKVEISSTGTTQLISGDEADYDFTTIKMPNFNLSADNFTELKVTAASVKGNVTDAKKFFNDNEIAVSDVKLSVSYGQTLKNFVVEYTLNGAAVKTTYAFTK